jgi:hypothetical protein
MTITTTTSVFTADDVRAAFYAHQVHGEIKSQYDGKATPAQVIADFAAESGDDQEERAYIAEYTALYERGAEILKAARVVMSARSTVEPGELVERQMRNEHPICSEFVTVDSGYLATAQSWRLIALATR